MSIRRDEVQISIAFLTDESKQYAKLVQENQQFIKDLKLAKKEGKDLTDVVQKMAASGAAISKIPLDKLAPTQLIQRAQQLKQVLSLIPQSAPEYKVLEKEFTAINSQLATMRVRTKGVADEMGKSEGFSKFTAGLAKGAAVVGVIIGTVKGFFSAIDKSAKFEQLNIAFTTFLGSAEKAKTVLADLKRFEVETPFNAEQVNDAGRALLAFGFSAEELIPTLRAVGDVAAGTGKDFNELALIYGKARAEGKIQNDTLNQLAEAGIPIYEELSKILKVGQDRIRKMAEEGKIGFNDLQKVFKNLSGEGGRFAGLMDKQSKSLDGLFSSLQSAITEKLVGTMNNLLPIIKAATTAFLQFLSVPVSQKLEDERQAFNGLTVQIYNANIGTKERTGLINKMKEQYPQLLKDIDSERATNEQLRPILDKINQSYVVRITLQRQQEKLQPILEAQADASERLANSRVELNKALAHGAELSGVNLALYQTEAEQLNAVGLALRKIVDNESPHLFATDEDKTLQRILSSQTLISVRQGDETRRIDEVSNAEADRLLVIDQLKKSYGELVDQIVNQPAATVKDAPGVPKSEEQRKKEAAAAAKAKKDVLEAELREVELAKGREEIVIENSFLKRQITEADFDQKMFTAKKTGFEDQLAVFKRYGEDQSSEALKVEQSLLKLQIDFENKKLDAQKAAEAAAQKLKADAIKAHEDGEKGRTDWEIKNIETRTDAVARTEEQALRDKFRAQVIAEGQFEEQIIQVRLNAADRKLQLLAEQGLAETDIYRKTQDEKAKAEQDLIKKQAENAKTAKELKKKQDEDEQKRIEMLGGFANDALQIGIDSLTTDIQKRKEATEAKIALLSIDEAARKKNAAEIKRLQNEEEASRKKTGQSIKAFQVAQVAANLAVELSSIWKNNNSSPANILFPGYGTLISGIQTALAVARAGIQVKTIRAQKFATGGFTGSGLPYTDETGHRPAGVVHGGEWVSPKWMVNSPKYGPVIQALESERMRGFAIGGNVPIINTTPTPGPLRNPMGGAAMPDFSQFTATVERMGQIVANMPREVKGKWVYADLEKTANEVTSVRSNAAL